MAFERVAGIFIRRRSGAGVDGRVALVIFSIGAAAGSFLALFLYAEFARYIQSKFALSTRLVNTSIAILFFAFAAYHIVKQLYLHVFKH